MKKYYVCTVDPDDCITEMFIKCNSLEQIDKGIIKVDSVEIKFKNEYIQEIKEV
jgi:hypothetical protein